MRNSSIKHHPNIETLADYAAGALEEARAVVIATHLTLCDECKVAVRDLETLGGVALETIEPAEMSENALSDFWSRLGEEHDEKLPTSMRPANDFDITAAQPLQRYLKDGIETIEWKPLAPGVSHHLLKAEGYRSGALRLLKIAPGTRIPKHSHKDSEFTLILKGSYKDRLGVFKTGDFADLDPDITHEPEAIGEEDCICLIATNAPLEFKTIIGKVIQPFMGL